MHKEKKESKRFGVKALVLTGALVLALNAAVGGTIAWLVSQTDSVTNTFTYGDIDITLTETDSDGDGDLTANTYDMVPGNSIDKDPLITVEAGSEDCWLFVKLDETENFDSFIEYEMAEGWTALEGSEGVYYQVVDRSESEQKFEVIAENQVTVKSDITKKMLNELDADGESNYPTLTVTAYAVQRDADIEAIRTVDKAWALAQEEA